MDIYDNEYKYVIGFKILKECMMNMLEILDVLDNLDMVDILDMLDISDMIYISIIPCGKLTECYGYTTYLY